MRLAGDAARRRCDSRDESERDEEGERVDGETGHPRSEGAEQEARDASTDEAADDLGALRQRVRCWEPCRGHDMRQQRAAGWAEEGAHRCLREPQHVEERHERGGLDERERDDDPGAQQIGAHHDSAAIPTVDVHTGGEANGERRHRLGDGHHRQRSCRSGELKDDEQDQQQGDPVADVGHDLAGEQVSIVADAQDVADAKGCVGHRSVFLLTGAGVEAQEEPVLGARRILEVLDLRELLDLAHDLAHARRAEPRMRSPQPHPALLEVLAAHVDEAGALARDDLVARLIEDRVEDACDGILAGAGEEAAIHAEAEGHHLVPLLEDAGHDPCLGDPDEATLLEQAEVVVELRLLRRQALGELLCGPAPDRLLAHALDDLQPQGIGDRLELLDIGDDDLGRRLVALRHSGASYRSQSGE